MRRGLQLLLSVVAIFAALAGSALAASSPSVTTGSASNIGHTSATLHGTVNPNGRDTTYFFQYGLTTSYGSNTAGKHAGKGTKPVAASGTARGLFADTVYHYRLVAVNRAGTTTGADRTFRTTGPPAPGAATSGAIDVTTSGATVTGVVNTNGATTGWAFQYGLTNSYGSQTDNHVLSASSTPKIVVAPLAGLTPGTIFHYRLVAFHGSEAVSYGDDQIFMTHPSPRKKPVVRDRITPHRDRHHPFTFTVSGRVIGPASIPAQFDCNGNVAVRYMLGHRTVSFQLVPVGSDCRFAAQKRFLRLPGRGKRPRTEALSVAVRFRGNPYIAPASARNGRVVLG